MLQGKIWQWDYFSKLFSLISSSSSSSSSRIEGIDKSISWLSRCNYFVNIMMIWRHNEAKTIYQLNTDIRGHAASARHAYTVPLPQHSIESGRSTQSHKTRPKLKASNRRNIFLNLFFFCELETFIQNRQCTIVLQNKST